MKAVPTAFFDFAKDKTLLRPSDAVALGRSRLYLAQLAQRGLLHKISRGLYAPPHRTTSEFATLAEIPSTHRYWCVCCPPWPSMD